MSLDAVEPTIDSLATQFATATDKNTGDSDVSQPNTATKPEEHAETHSEGDKPEADGLPDVEEPDAPKDDSVETADDETDPDDKAEDFEEVQLPDGSVEKILRDELKKGYLRQADYTRKQQEATETFKAEVARIDQIKQQQLAALTAYNQKLEQIDPVSLLQAQRNQAAKIGDEAEYNRLGLAIMETKQQLAESKAAQAQLESERNAKAEADARAYIAKGYETLAKKLPGFADPAKREVFKSTITKSLQKVGYSDQEIANIGDPRAAEVAYYAGKYLEMQNAKPKVAEALKGKAIAPSTTSRGSGKMGKTDAAQRTFNSNPSLDSLAGLFKAHNL